MTGWAKRRHWRGAARTTSPRGWVIRLDGAPLRTPAGNAMEVPTEALAERLVGEWSEADGIIAPSRMPFTRLAGSAIDRGDDARGKLIESLAGYAATELICHRADQPEELVARQRAGWNPVLDWLEAKFGAPLASGSGVMPLAQPERSLRLLRDRIGELERFALSGFAEMVALSGSLALALAVLHGRLTRERAWSLATIDESWQAEKWGADEECEAELEGKRRAFELACAFVEMTGR